jgi:imidazole glycerol-phosphate synthase subunit HisF
VLTLRVIPCLDVRDGRVVKGVRFANLRDAGTPETLAAAYERDGADELVLLDVSATPEGRAASLETVRRVRRAIGIPLTVGGGVRRADDAAALLDAGADKVGINTAAVETPDLVGVLAERFGRQCTVVAIDAAANGPDRWLVVTHSGTRRTELDALEWASTAERRGAGEILLTSFDRDGTRSGYDLPLLRAMAQTVNVPVIASGGAGTLDHLVAGLAPGRADAVLAASIFHFGDSRIADARAHLARHGIPMRRTA